MRQVRSGFWWMLGLAALVQAPGCHCFDDDTNGATSSSSTGTTGREDPAAQPTEHRATTWLHTAGPCPLEVRGQDGVWRLEDRSKPERRPPPGRGVLDRLCSYRWFAIKRSSPPELDAFDPDVHHDAGPQVPVVQLLGAASTEQRAVVVRAREALAAQAEAVSFTEPPSTTVIVGFPDTSREPQGAEPVDAIPLGTTPPGVGPVAGVRGNPHGFNLAWLNRYLTCPEGAAPGRACLTSPRMLLATQGGRKGTREELAEAIRKLAGDWAKEQARRATAGQPRQPLIVNLAAGWEPAYECLLRSSKLVEANRRRERPKGKDKPSQDPLAVNEPVPFAELAPECLKNPAPLSDEGRAVLEAIQFATCHGALVVAAAGNDPLTIPQRQGPMLPAAWETHDAPDAATCAAVGVNVTVPSSPDPADAAPYRPLVYAASGVNSADAPILLARTKGVARIVAPASLLAAYPTESDAAGYRTACGLPSTTVATVPLAQPLCDKSYPMTGSSIAATVVSSAAAAVWAYRPELDAHQVMKLVHASGQDLGPSDAVFSLTPGVTVSRVSVCRAAHAARPSITCRTPVVARPAGSAPSLTPLVIPGSAPFDETGLAGIVDPQPTWPCPDCRAHFDFAVNSTNPWHVDGSIPSEAWSALGAVALRIQDDTTRTNKWHIGLYNDRNESLDGRIVVTTSPVEAPGFSGTTTPPAPYADGAWAVSTSALPVTGAFKATAPPSDITHLMLFFEQTTDGTKWFSAAQEIPIVP